MKSSEIMDLFQRFESAAEDYDGILCWSVQDLQLLLGYTKWENFSKVIEKAKNACIGAGQKQEDHFPGVRKVIEVGKCNVLIPHGCLQYDSSAYGKTGIKIANIPILPRKLPTKLPRKFQKTTQIMYAICKGVRS